MAKGPYERLDENLPRAQRDSLGATRGSVVAVGNFDGVHRGHAAVLSAAVERARHDDLASCVLTFDPHPSVVLGRQEPPRLTSLDRRAKLIARLGIEHVFVRTFDAAFAAWTPERFVEELIVGRLSARVVMIGENFRFGAKAAGRFATMKALGEKLGFETIPHPLVGDVDGAYSSSRVRAAIASGDIEGAARILGRPHALSGVVETGKKLGRTLGFPTANLDKVAEMLPPDGIYATLVDRVDASTGHGKATAARALGFGAMSIGVRPTLGSGLQRIVEVHVLDADLDLYGAVLRVHVVSRIRDEERFSGLDTLKTQIARDVEETRRRLSGREAGANGAFG